MIGYEAFVESELQTPKRMTRRPRILILPAARGILSRTCAFPLRFKELEPIP
jgi:hypothetical protein